VTQQMMYLYIICCVTCIYTSFSHIVFIYTFLKWSEVFPILTDQWRRVLALSKLITACTNSGIQSFLGIIHRCYNTNPLFVLFLSFPLHSHYFFNILFKFIQARKLKIHECLAQSEPTKYSNLKWLKKNFFLPQNLDNLKVEMTKKLD
jgi:hypothetical protein